MVFVNGRFVPEDQAVVSTFDRGFVYGDGVFETIRIHNGQPFRWKSHLERFNTGAQFLKITPPFSSDELRQGAQKLVEHNALKHGVVRIVLSRGTGARGYSPKGVGKPTCVMSSHELSSAAEATDCRVITSGYRVNSDDPLIPHKTCNKLLQVMARAAAEEAGADEGLLVNNDDEAVTASGANLFWVWRNVVCTPPVQAGALPGITRSVVRELCEKDRLPYEERMIPARELASTQGVFLTLSSKGIVPVTKLDGTKLVVADEIQCLQEAYVKLVRDECTSDNSRSNLCPS